MKRKNAVAVGLSKVVQIKEFGIACALIAIMLIVGSINNTFFAFENIINMLRSACGIFIIAIPTTMVLISAGLDLSVGSVVALAGICTGNLVVMGYPALFCIFVGLLVGMAIGGLNGFLIVVAKMPPLIVTLGMMFSISGLVIGITNGAPVYPFTEEFKIIGQGHIGVVPLSVIITMGLAVVAHISLTKTRYGRSIFAIGGNEEVSRLSGISISKIKMSVYMLSGMAAALSGIFLASRLNSAQPSAGSGYEMQVIASVIIGGTSMFGGSGSILGSFIGCFLMTVITTGMVLARVSAYWQDFIMGIIIILAVFMDRVKRSKSGLQ